MRVQMQNVAVVAATLICLAGAGFSQSTDGDGAQPPSPGLSLGPADGMGEVSAAFIRVANTCFEPGVASDHELEIAVGFSETGEAQQFTLLAPQETLNQQERAIWRQSIAALIKCAPYEEGLRGPSLEMQRLYTSAGGFFLPGGVSISSGDDDGDDGNADGEDTATDTSTADGSDGVSAAQATENAMGLTKSDKREVQRRLTLIGYNTNGIDGVFGPGSRSAITNWQVAAGFSPSSYLAPKQLSRLVKMSAKKYAEWQARPKNYLGKDGCLRRPNGRIIVGRTVRCDLRALNQ